MIANVTRGSTFGALTSYLLQGRGDREEQGLQDYLLGPTINRASWTSVRNMPVNDPELASAVMSATAAQNERVQKPVYHLSLAVADDEELIREQWEQVADRVLDKLGLREHQVLIVAHDDTEHHHIHLMINRVHPEKLKAWSNSHDYYRVEKILRHLERDMGLRRVPGHHYRLRGQERPEREGQETRGEQAQRGRTGEPSWAEKVRFQTYDTLRGAKSWRELEEGLARRGLRLRRRGGGLVVTDGERMVKASRLYRRASYKWLEKRFGRSYEEWQTQRRREGRGPQHRQSGPAPSERSRSAPADRPERQIRFRAYKILRESTNWGELERGLAAQGLRLQRRGGELVVKDRHQRVRTSRIYRRASHGWLERRFGMSFEQWRRGRRELVDMIDRYRQAERESRRLRSQRGLAARQWDDAKRSVQFATEARTATHAEARRVNGILREIYHPKAIRSARRRIAGEARRVGWEAAAKRVAERPGRYGRLAQGVVRRVAQRKAHRRLLRRLVSAAQDLSVYRAVRRKFGPSAYRALQVIPRAQQQVIRASGRLDRLSPTAMQREIAARALALGVAAVRLTLSPQPSEIVRTAVRTLQLARSVGRERERGR